MVAKDQAVTRVGMPMDEFIRRFDVEGPFELIDGEVIPKMPNIFIHVLVVNTLLDALLIFRQTNPFFRAFSEQTFAMIDAPDWVKGSRIPDIAIYMAERLTEYFAQTPDWEHKPSLLIPDICIEVISPNDKADEIESKVQRYLLDGVRAVWLVYPEAKTISLHHRSSNQITRLTAEDKLEDADLLPGFSVLVRSIFPE